MLPREKRVKTLPTKQYYRNLQHDRANNNLLFIQPIFSTNLDNNIIIYCISVTV